MKLHLFFHVWMTNHWRDIVAELLDVVRSSGLGDEAKLTIGAIGTQEDFSELALMARQVGASVVHFGDDEQQYEFPTLELLRLDAHTHHGAVCYFHTKGVSHADHEGIRWWRRTMADGILRHWRRCVQALEDGSDTAGCRFWLGDDRLPYYAGNFWWAKADHIRKLPPISRQSRFEAEVWLFKVPPAAMDIPVERPL